MIPAPPYPIWTAFIASALMPLLLLCVSRGALAIRQPKLRLYAAVVLASGAWLILLWAGAGSGLQPDALVAGGFLLATAALAVYSAWALIGYGFTLSMLADLAAAEKALPEREWANRFGAGRGLRAMVGDRMNVLSIFCLVQKRGDEWHLSGRPARALAALTVMAMRIMIVRQEG